jgi:hypothetical protein
LSSLVSLCLSPFIFFVLVLVIEFYRVLYRVLRPKGSASTTLYTHHDSHYYTRTTLFTGFKSRVLFSRKSGGARGGDLWRKVSERCCHEVCVLAHKLLSVTCEVEKHGKPARSFAMHGCRNIEAVCRPPIRKELQFAISKLSLDQLMTEGNSITKMVGEMNVRKRITAAPCHLLTRLPAVRQRAWAQTSIPPLVWRRV